jgi:hypothetical protein
MENVIDTSGAKKIEVNMEPDKSLIPQMLSNGPMVTNLNACAARNSRAVHRSLTKYHVKQLIQQSPRNDSFIMGILRRRGCLCI